MSDYPYGSIDFAAARVIPSGAEASNVIDTRVFTSMATTGVQNARVRVTSYNDTAQLYRPIRVTNSTADDYPHLAPDHTGNIYSRELALLKAKEEMQEQIMRRRAQAKTQAKAEAEAIPSVEEKARAATTDFIHEGPSWLAPLKPIGAATPTPLPAPAPVPSWPGLPQPKIEKRKTPIDPPVRHKPAFMEWLGLLGSAAGLVIWVWR